MVAQNTAFVAVVAGFWHVSWVAGVGMLASGLQSISASGSPEECKAKVREYVANGATCPILYPLGDDVGLMLETFAGGDLE